jgi:hypothetical protein
VSRTSREGSVTQLRHQTKCWRHYWPNNRYEPFVKLQIWQPEAESRRSGPFADLGLIRGQAKVPSQGSPDWLSSRTAPTAC